MTTSSESADRVTGLDDVVDRVAERFGRSEPRRRASADLRGLLSSVGRKNGWQLAEAAGDRTPHGVPQAWQNGEKVFLRVAHRPQLFSRPMPQCGQNALSASFRSTARSHPGHTPFDRRESATS